MEALLVAVVGVLGAAAGATLSSWLGARQRVAEELHDRRLATYPAAWQRTSVVSRWPRTNAGYVSLDRMHRDLRHWYFGSGGLYLSTNARVRYGELQELLAAVLETPHRDGPLDERGYTDLMESASAFRTALTEDLESRQQRSLVSSTRLALTHRRQSAAAAQRLDGRRRSAHPVLHQLEAAEEHLLDADPGPATADRSPAD